MSPAVPRASSADDLYTLTGSIEPTRLTWPYRAGLVVVAIAMLILPLVYLGLIASAGGVVWWHLTANTWIVTGSKGGFWRLLAYVGPAVAGCVLIFFMIKPVLARPARRTNPIPIPPDAEPDLFRFVLRICEQVRAPVPSRIQVDCNVNASASFGSVMTLLRPDFVLTIGLPLAAGLTIRQLGGVLAHEFGHFAQGGGMRLTFLVRSINGWFARVVGERDQWDEKLERWAKQGDWRISLILLLAQASIWCSRHILRGLMIAGHGISCFMLRQMEYDADSYEMKLVGSATFIETSARLRELNAAAEFGYYELREGWVRRTLPSNLPAFMVNHCGRLPRDVAAKVRGIPQGTTGIFDTHPADADRIRAAERANAHGILDDGDQPATLLFREFDALSMAATRHHYEHELHVSLESATFVDTDAALEASATRQKAYQSAETYFGRYISVLRPIDSRMPGIEALTATELVQKLVDARRAMCQGDDKGDGPYRDYEECDRKLALARAARALFEAGFTEVVAQDFDLAEGTAACADEAVAFATLRLRNLEPGVRRLDEIAARRLACAFALLERAVAYPAALTVSVLDAHTRETLRQEAADLVPALVALADAWPHLNELRRLLTAGALVSGNASGSPDSEAAQNTLTAIVDRLCAHLQKIRTVMADTQVPDTDPGHSRRLSTLLGLDSALDAEVKASHVLNAAISVRSEVVGRLCAIALQVEESDLVSSADVVG